MGTSSTPGQQYTQLIGPFQQRVNAAAAKLAVRNPSLVRKGNQGTLLQLVKSVYNGPSVLHISTEQMKTASQACFYGARLCQNYFFLMIYT